MDKTDGFKNNGEDTQHNEDVTEQVVEQIAEPVTEQITEQITEQVVEAETGAKGESALARSVLQKEGLEGNGLLLGSGQVRMQDTVQTEVPEITVEQILKWIALQTHMDVKGAKLFSMLTKSQSLEHLQIANDPRTEIKITLEVDRIGLGIWLELMRMYSVQEWRNILFRALWTTLCHNSALMQKLQILLDENEDLRSRISET